MTDKDRGYRATLKALLGALRPPVLTVGIHSDEGGRNLAIGGYHEFGTDRMPQRSFIGAWAEENESVNEKVLLAFVQPLAQGKTTIEDALQRAGVTFVGSIQARMASGIDPEKKDGTPARLIDTGQLRSSIRAKVE